ncbi:MAG: EI24 domain-containing protein, partial [Rhodospirillales bacterium]
MIDAFIKAIRQLGDPAIRRVLWIGIGVSLAVFAVLWSAVGYLLTQTTLFQTGWLDTAVDALGGIATLAISWFLFPVVISAFVGLFLEGIAEAV